MIKYLLWVSWQSSFLLFSGCTNVCWDLELRFFSRREVPLPDWPRLLLRATLPTGPDLTRQTEELELWRVRNKHSKLSQGQTVTPKCIWTYSISKLKMYLFYCIYKQIMGPFHFLLLLTGWFLHWSNRTPYTHWFTPAVLNDTPCLL